jgi:hypothetical protein
MMQRIGYLALLAFLLPLPSTANATDGCSPLCVKAQAQGVLGCDDIFAEAEKIRLRSYGTDIQLRQELQDWMKTNGRDRSQAQIMEDNIVSAVDTLISGYRFQEAHNQVNQIFIRYDRSVNALRDIQARKYEIQTERERNRSAEKSIQELTSALADARQQNKAPSLIGKLERGLKLAVEADKLSAAAEVYVDFIARNFLLIERIETLIGSAIKRIESSPELLEKYDRPETDNDFFGKLKELQRSLGDPSAWVNLNRKRAQPESMLESMAMEPEEIVGIGNSAGRVIDRLTDYDQAAIRRDPNYRRVTTDELMQIVSPYKKRFDVSRAQKEIDSERDFFWASMMTNASVRQMVFTALRKATQVVPWLGILRTKNYSMIRALDNTLSIYDYEINHSWKINDVVQTGYNEAISSTARAKHQANRLRDFANELGFDGGILLEYFYRRTDTLRFREAIEKAADDMATQGEPAFKNALLSAKSRVYTESGAAKLAMLNPVDPSLRRYTRMVMLDNAAALVSAALTYFLAGNVGLIDTQSIQKNFQSYWATDSDDLADGKAINPADQMPDPAASTQSDSSSQSNPDQNADDGLQLTGPQSVRRPNQVGNKPGFELTGSSESDLFQINQLTYEVMMRMREAAKNGDQLAQQAEAAYRNFSQSMAKHDFAKTN